MRRKRLLAVLAACGIVVCSCSGSGDDGSTFVVPCDDPAPVSETPALSGILTVALRDDADASAEAARIASTCGFEVTAVLEFGHGFQAVLDIVQLGCVRCDEVVTRVIPNTPLFPAD